MKHSCVLFSVINETLKFTVVGTYDSIIAFFVLREFVIKQFFSFSDFPLYFCRICFSNYEGEKNHL